jgi:integrator complex subunit 6
MERCGITQSLITRPKGTCWAVYVKNSHLKPGMGYPFGFFRVSNTGNAVNLYLLPYDFPRLFRILSLNLLI